MLQLAKDINAGIVQTSGEEKNSGQAAMEGAEIKTAVCDMNIVMGYRDENTFLLDEFKEQAASFVATEDGSVGTKGNVIDAIKENALEADVIYACGPMPMLRALKAYLQSMIWTALYQWRSAWHVESVHVLRAYAKQRTRMPTAM